MVATVSVVMSVYNGETYLRRAVDSILKQTFKEFEFIIINDCSDDGTAEILDRFRRDERVKIFENAENIGLTKSLNIGLHRATGKYIARQDADDISYPHRFAEQVEFLDAHPKSQLVAGNLEFINKRSRVIATQERHASAGLVAWYMLFYNHVAGHSQVMFRRQTALKVGGYDESLRYSQDYGLWLRLGQEGNLSVVPKVWVKWRSHSDSISQQKAEEQEQLSLRQSRKQLEMLLGYNVSMDFMKALRGFWLGPFSGNPADVNAVLRDAYRKFIGRYPALANELRAVIANRFVAWGRSISIRQNPTAKLDIWRYAWGWNPGSLRSELTDLIQQNAQN